MPEADTLKRAVRLLAGTKGAAWAHKSEAMTRRAPASSGSQSSTQREQHVDPSAWTGGQGFVPQAQNTQQSPDLGRSTALQFSHS